MDGVTSAGSTPVDPNQFAPPPEPHKEHGKPKGTDKQGDGSQSTQNTDQTDTGSSVNTYRENEEQESQGESESGGSGSGGSSSGGSSDSGGSFSGGGRQNQDSRDETNVLLKEIFGTSNVVDGVLVNSATGTEKVAVASDVMSRAAVQMDASYTAPLAAKGPSQPLLFKPSGFDAAAVLAEARVNPWFTSSFLVTITMNLMSIVAIQSKVQEAEMKIAVQMMDFTISQAHMTGDLILATAQKEAQMYMAMAIASLVSLAVGLVGAGMSGVGKVKASTAKMKMKQMKTDSQVPPKDTHVKGDVVGSDAGQSLKVKTKSETKLDKTNDPNAPKDTTPDSPSVDNKAAELKKDAVDDQKQTDQKIEDNKQEAKADTKKVTFADGTRDNQRTGAGNAEPELKVEGQIKSQDKNIKRKEQNAQNEAQVREQELAPKKSDDITSPEAKAIDMEKMKKLDKKREKWEQFGGVGTTLVQLNNTFNTMVNNFIQMLFKPEIGALERAKTLSEGSQKIIASGLDYSVQAFNNAGQIIDSALQELQKIQDETSRANDWKG